MRKFWLSFLCFGGIALATGGLMGSKAASGPANVTFSKDVAPILYNNCAVCHHPGDIAPFSVISYKDVRPWARSIEKEVVSKEMPPWPADPHFGAFSNDRRLSDHDVNTISAWVEQGAAEGNPADLPKAPDFYEDWHIGKPDIILTMPKAHTVAPNGPDEYVYVKVPTNFDHDVWIQAVEAKPGNRKIVHHIIAFVLPPEKGFMSIVKPTQAFMDEIRKKLAFYQDGSLQMVKADAPVIDDGCSSVNGGGGVFLDDSEREGFGRFLAGEAPGLQPAEWPEGDAKLIPAGSTILLQIHYHRQDGADSKAETDQSSIGFKLAKVPPDKEVITEPVVNYHFRIPAGDANHEVTSCYTFKNDSHILGLTPHMHLRGKDMTIMAYYPDGRKETLLEVPHYSFNWQTTYYLKNPVALPKGTKVVCVAHFDNSDKNKYNPDPTKSVRFGDPTYAEMMIGFVEYTVDSQHLQQETARAAAAGGK
ncbi:MAG TPA: thiol-disulfide isomerase [Blastocatellia bacterium]